MQILLKPIFILFEIKKKTIVTNIFIIKYNNYINDFKTYFLILSHCLFSNKLRSQTHR